MPLAVHFGAGNIGRGFLGQIYDQSGYETVFIDLFPEVIEALNRNREYTLRLVAKNTETLTIKNVRGLMVSDVEAIADVVAKADIASTAVGVRALDSVVPLLVVGLRKRQEENPKPLNVILCENHHDAAGHVRELLPVDLKNQVGLIEASVGRMVPQVPTEAHLQDPLLVSAEPFFELPVDADAFLGPIPSLRGVAPKTNFRDFIDRKLCVHNAGHAVAAYLGYLRGHEFIWQAMEDSKIETQVVGAMNESCAALARRGMDPHELMPHAADLASRFKNRQLGDQIRRVAADPIRKLGQDDRFIRALRLCSEQGVHAPCLALGAAAVLQYSYQEDPAAVELQAVVEQLGIEGALKQVASLATDDPILRIILSAASRLDNFR